MATLPPILRKRVIRQVSYFELEDLLVIISENKVTNKFGFLIVKVTIPQHKITIPIPINVKKICSVEAFSMVLILI